MKSQRNEPTRTGKLCNGDGAAALLVHARVEANGCSILHCWTVLVRLVDVGLNDI